MSRHLLVVLLLATSVALADRKPEAKDAAGTAEAEVKTEAVRGQTEEIQPTTKAAHESTAESQAATTKLQGRTEAAEVKTQAEPEGALAKTKAAQERAADPQANMEEAQADKDGRLISVPGGKALGMSVLGNQEAPTSLVIVPWKSSEVGRSPGISPMLDDSRQPVDKEVFMRALRYYEIRSETKP
jgi:type IV secretory pathway VirB10-like protein